MPCDTPGFRGRWPTTEPSPSKKRGAWSGAEPWRQLPTVNPSERRAEVSIPKPFRVRIAFQASPAPSSVYSPLVWAGGLEPPTSGL